MDTTRREWLRAVGGLGVVGVAGCSGTGGSGGAAEGTDRTDSETDESTSSAGRPPTADQSLYLGHDVETISDNIVSGGVPKDGIPAIDDPTFGPPDEAPLDPGDPVFGVVRDGEAKAYPQRILVFHEIVNDTVAGDPVAVTYCPLTGTAQGFERGPVEFGVSGRLVNSNLTMYDRGTDSWWPQVLATAVRGQMQGATLQEFRVVWTTWEAWRAEHPDTVVLTEDTGFQRRYGTDPYGSYNPKRGYYASDRTLFSPLESDGRADPKRVVVGTRTSEGALTFDKETVLAERVLTGDIDGTQYVAVADDVLSTAYVYANPDAVTVKAVDDGYRVDGETHAPDALPLDRTLAFDGMWFAWAGFYPGVDYVR
ncbi:DUF3179 domain-containing protein [Halomicroarcula sp. F13]|uniref:DUF3179 domain-containing protein n=1 Tax=Haloarcula rubra TaxID=2487747 RepID=A0AAW4PTS1_9EURY|nr:DUF3179 domain-containing protein [Halomicroarcula rubra]MBX0323677.1 DUF3179 domain-containing protein [Halomicroarcula rubra]